MSKSSSSSHVSSSHSNILSNGIAALLPTQSSIENDKSTSRESLPKTPDGCEPTEEEITTLRHISDHIPLTCWLAAGISLTERFTYCGINSPFQNYVQNPPGNPNHPGALNLGQTRATNLNDAFQFFVYLSPIGWGIIADTRLGRYKTICYAVAIYLAGVILIFGTSTPAALQHNVGVGGFIAGIITAGLGLGGLKACVPPLMGEKSHLIVPKEIMLILREADQYTETKLRIKTIKKAERVIIDRNLTLQSIYGLWYWCVNIGSLSGIATTVMEKKIGFWAAYLLPTCFLFLAPILLLIGRQRFVRRKPVGSVLASSFKVFSAASKVGFKMNLTKPDYQRVKFGKEVGWTASFVEELKLGLVACQVFIAFPIAWMCHSQINTNLVSQASQMETYGIPNDTFQNLSALTVIFAMPLVQNLLYPGLRKLGISFPPISRIAVGFFLQGAAMAYGSIAQKIIYNAGPCYEHPLKCSLPSGQTSIPNHVSIAVQLPAYMLDGLAGIFFYPTGQEYAYTKAPSSMKSLIQAVLLFTVAVGCALAFALSPSYKDPTNVIMYATLGGVMILTSAVFYFALRKYNGREESMNRTALENEQEGIVERPRGNGEAVIEEG